MVKTICESEYGQPVEVDDLGSLVRIVSGKCEIRLDRFQARLLAQVVKATADEIDKMRAEWRTNS